MITYSSQREERGRDQLKSGCGRNTRRNGVPSRSVSEMIRHEVMTERAVAPLSPLVLRNRLAYPR